MQDIADNFDFAQFAASQTAAFDSYYINILFDLIGEDQYFFEPEFFLNAEALAVIPKNLTFQGEIFLIHCL